MVIIKTTYLTFYNTDFLDSTLGSTVGGKKVGIFGGKGKINDPFFMGPNPGPCQDDLATIESEGTIVRWRGGHERFAITVGNPEKSSKLGGMKLEFEKKTPTFF